MAATLTTQTLHDGERNAIILGKIAGDGVADLTDGVLVDVSALSGAPSKVKVMKIKATSSSAMSALLEWDATADVAFHLIPEGANYEQCFRDVGGIINNAGAGVTGDILITTTGEAATEDMTIMIWVQKK